ncbi:MAG: Gfo/Idh/MocA family oxidoreductase [Propionibacteriaceae bacterium]|jgi:predicted dehydrogenase|nr:Gfo/Idh/MocA family oxidoreductase [Propionibacteriaceae bacterium]
MSTTVMVIGAGQRGRIYADLMHELGARVVAVAEPDPDRRERFAREFQLEPEGVFIDWQAALATPRLADVAVISTQDQDHVAPAVAAATLGYQLLIEKPMATDRAGARAIVAAVEQAGVIAAVCHVMRYTAYTRQLKRLLVEGAIGRIIGMQHLEPVGWWHFAHSFVRGNWRRAEESSSLLLQKCVHDIDWIAYIMDEPVRSVSSFGSLQEFRPENRPSKAAGRCLDCPIDECPYDATRIYRGFLDDPQHRVWPLAVLTPDPDRTTLDQALRTGPYGECVYLGRNDVVDHQVVSMEFSSGANVSFMVSAFTEMANRKTRIFGHRGWIEGDGSVITVFDFATTAARIYDTAAGGSSAAEGHGGGDRGMIAAFLQAVVSGDQALVESTPAVSLTALEITWAAEEAREHHTVVDLGDAIATGPLAEQSTL